MLLTLFKVWNNENNIKPGIKLNYRVQQIYTVTIVSGYWVNLQTLTIFFSVKVKNLSYILIYSVL